MASEKVMVSLAASDAVTVPAAAPAFSWATTASTLAVIGLASTVRSTATGVELAELAPFTSVAETLNAISPV